MGTHMFCPSGGIGISPARCSVELSGHDGEWLGTMMGRSARSARSTRSARNSSEQELLVGRNFSWIMT